MRIITGEARGTRLETLEGEETRPTAERIKEAVFSSLHFRLEGTRFLDLFAGSGQMGLEAISRGAAFAVFVDAGREAAEIIKNNAKKTKLFDRCRVVNTGYEDYLRGAAGKEQFDIVYIDPPFAAHLIPQVLSRLARADILAKDAVVLCEDERDTLFDEDSDAAARFTIEKSVRYGRMYIYYLHAKKGDETA